MRLLVALFLLLLGLVLALLLNGQTFTNSLLAIGCAGASCAIVLRSARDHLRGTDGRRLASRIVASLAVLLAIILLTQLPSAYRDQDAFNRKMDQLRKLR